MADLEKETGFLVKKKAALFPKKAERRFFNLGFGRKPERDWRFFAKTRSTLRKVANATQFPRLFLRRAARLLGALGTFCCGLT